MSRFVSGAAGAAEVMMKGDGVLTSILRKSGNACRSFNDPNNPICRVRTRAALKLKGASLRMGKSLPEDREKIVLLGSGWGTFYMLKHLDPFRYDVHVISPKKSYYFTPLLNLVATGVLHPAAVTVAIRDCLFRGGKKVMQFYNATAEDINANESTLTCRSKNGESFTVKYNKLVLAIGAETNTFGIPGAMEHSMFLKTTEDANALRRQLINQFEKASLPGTSAEERKRLLSLVVVGGGPAGVETAGALMDMVKSAMAKHYPEVVNDASVHVIEMLPKVLPVFNEGASKFALSALRSNGCAVHLQHKVVKVGDTAIETTNVANEKINIPYGFLLWVSGVGPVPFAKTLISRIPGQAGNRIPRVDPSLKLMGASNIYAMGDCAFMTPLKMEEPIDQLYQMASESKEGAGTNWLRKHRAYLIRERKFAQLHPSVCDLNKIDAEANGAVSGGLSKSDFLVLLKKIDGCYKPAAPTGQFARQAAAYLGTCLSRRIDGTVPFIPRHLGDFADVGSGKACLELKVREAMGKGIIRVNGGLPVFLFRRGFYWYANWSKQNKAAMLIDYMRMGLIGRNIRVEDRCTSVEAQRNRT